MADDDNKLAWRVIGLIVSVVGILVPAIFSLILHSLGVVPEKNLELVYGRTVNPLADLSSLGDKVTLNLTIEDQTYKNVQIYTANLKNIGRAPILPSDFFENLSASVKEPWKIIAVKNQSDSPGQPRLF